MTEPPGVGAELARAREAAQLSVSQVARLLKYAPRQIEALEAEAWDRLPEGTFARGMLRAYARLLKLDAEALVARAGERIAPGGNSDASAPARRRIPIADGRRRANLLYGALALAALLPVGYVALEWRAERERAARPAFVPAARMPVEPAPVDLATAAPLREAGAESDQNPAVSAPKPLVLRFERESWVEVRDASGRVLLSHLHGAGSERTLQAEPPLQLVIGNARHVRLTYGGEAVDLAPHIKVDVARLRLP